MSSNQQEPRVVKEVPKGYSKEFRNGKEVYVLKRKQEPKPTSNNPNNAVKKVYKSGVKAHKRNTVIPSDSEDVVMLEQPDNTAVSQDNSVVDNKKYFVGPDAKSYFKKDDSNPLYTLITAPNETGNYTNKATNYYTDKAGMPIYQPNSSDFVDGKFAPRYTGETLEQLRAKSLQQYTLPSSDGVTKKNTDPNAKVFSDDFTMSTNETGGGNELQQIKVQPKLYDNQGNLINNEIKPKEVVSTMPKFKKGGLVGKIKGYEEGGVVGQNDPYSEAKKEEQNKANTKKALNVAGEALGGYGQSYYSTTPTANKSDAVRSTVLGSVSQMGVIGGAIGGITAIGDQIGKPIKESSERMSSSGELLDEGRAKQNAIVGSLFDPTKALVYRSESGNWGDVSGQGYVDYLEGKAKKQVAEVKKANADDVISQALANRDSGNLEGKITQKYDLNKIKFDENQNMILDGYTNTYKKGGLVQKLKDGGQIIGKGTAKSDSINAKVEEGSFVVPAENAEIAKGIRELYLKVPKSKKANLNQKEGEEVKLSNGEHLFTPEENEYLESVGVELEKLAPNAEKKESNMKYKDGTTKGGVSSKKSKVPSYKFKVPSAQYNPSDDVTLQADKLSPNQLVALQVERAKIAKENENAMALNKSLPQELPTTTTAMSSSSNKKTSNLLGNIDPTAFVGVAQSALGINMLKGEKRPVWDSKIDATYDENVNRAIKDASFGLTPEQKFLAEQDIQNSLTDAKFQGVNFAGGSGVQAYNLNRSAINDAWKNKLGLKQADTEMRMQKQKYADAQVADRANILANNRRTAFGDAMNAFQQKQQAGSELIGAGLSNVIGAYRFNQEMKNKDRADVARSSFDDKV